MISMVHSPARHFRWPEGVNPGWLILVLQIGRVVGYWNATLPMKNSRLGFMHPGSTFPSTVNGCPMASISVSKDMGDADFLQHLNFEIPHGHFWPASIVVAGQVLLGCRPIHQFLPIWMVWQNSKKFRVLMPAIVLNFRNHYHYSSQLSLPVIPIIIIVSIIVQCFESLL